MGSQLHQALRSLCSGSQWKYAVFWKLRYQARVLLTWEDAYYDSEELSEKNYLNDMVGNLHELYLRNPLGLAMAKMSYHVYSLGEGIVGQVAVTGKHLWISADKKVAEPISSFEYSDGWQPQFSAGIKTIAVVAVPPLGVVQLGSLDSIVEDLKVVNDIRNVFLELQNPLAGWISDVMQCSMDGSCVSDTSTRTLGLEGCRDSLHNLDTRIDVKGTDFSGTIDMSFEQPSLPSCVFSTTQGYQDQALQDKHENSEISMAGTGQSNILVLPSLENSHIKRQEELQLQAGRDTTTSLTTECSRMNISSYSSEYVDFTAYNYQNEMLHVPETSNVPLHEGLKYTDSQSLADCRSKLHISSMFSAGYELYEALGPAFHKENAQYVWEKEKTENDMGKEIPEELGTTNFSTELLEAVIANVKHTGDDSISPCSKSVESLLAPEMISEPCQSDVGTICSVGYSFDRDTLNSVNSTSSCGILSSKGISSTSCSSSGHVGRPQEPVKSNKKRARPGESCRPRPRDRQLIQDRIKELRELIPNGAKCSIDSLLERTIKHMLFMQNITKHADKLNKCSASKLLDKESGTRGSFEHEQGSSWAVEVGSNMKVCPIIVENISMNGQMLIEILCEGCRHFLEIAESIRNLGLTILKGFTEAYGEKTRMSFVVEGQNNRSIHRMDVLWSLVQLLQPKI